MELLGDTGDVENITKDPTLTGYLTDDGPIAYLTVQFDHGVFNTTTGVFDFDGSADDSVVADGSGYFTYVPTDLTAGAVSIKARAREWDYDTDAYLYGAWTDATDFTYEVHVVEVPTFADLQLRVDSPLLFTGNVTDDGGELGNILVEFDLDPTDGTDAPHGWAYTDQYGYFQYQPAKALSAPVDIKTRTSRFDYGQSDWVNDGWASSSHTYQTPTSAAPIVAHVSLANDTGDTPLTTTDTTVVGRIFNAVTLAGVMIEFEYDATLTGPEYSMMTDAQGAFAFTPNDLTPDQQTTITVTAKELDETTGDWLVGASTSMTFTYEEPTNAPATIDSLALENDLADVNDPPLATDPTLTGQVSNDGELSSLIIEFDFGIDKDGDLVLDDDYDGIIDGTTTTDSEGRFTFTPVDLELGQIYARARVKEYGEDSTIIYSDDQWVDCPEYIFELRSATLEVAELMLNSDTGTSVDGATSVSTLTGKVVGPDDPADIDNVKVEFDHDGDGEAETNGFAMTTDADFTYNPAGLAFGLVTIQARTVVEDLLGSQYGNWLPLSFVLYDTANPPVFSQADAEALVASMAAEDADWQHPGNSSAAVGFATALMYAQNVQTAESDFESDRASRAATYGSATSTATDAYEDALHTANGTYDTDAVEAGDTFNSNLSDFIANLAPEDAGDEFSSSIEEFAWLKTPEENALVIPDDDDQPASPVNAPTYVGPDYDLSLDNGYPDAMVDADNTYHGAVRLAAETLQTKREEAKTVFEQAVGVAQQVYKEEVADALNQYNLDAHDPDFDGGAPFDLAQQTNANHLGKQAAQLEYDTAVAGYDQERDDRVAAGWDWNDAERERNIKVAEALYLKEVTEHALDKTLADAIAAVEAWEKRIRPNAKYVYDQAVASAEKTRTEAIADARKIEADFVAEAVRAHGVELATAEAARRDAQITAKQNAINAWDAIVDTEWSDYQKKLVANEAQYVTNWSIAYLQHATLVTNAVKVESLAVSSAVKTHEYDVAGYEWTRTNDRALNQLTYQEAVIAADKAQAEGQALRLQQRDDKTSLAEKNQTIADLNNWWYHGGLGVHDEAFPLYDWISYSANVAHYRDALQAAFRDEDIILDYNQALDAAAESYQHGYHSAEKTWIESVSNAAATRDIDLAQADRDYSVDVVGAAGRRDNTIAQANTERVEKTAAANRQLADTVASLTKTRNDDDATDRKTFEDNTVVAYRTDVGAWDTSENTPWSAYLLDLAEAEETRIKALTTSNVTYVSQTGQADLDWANAANLADEDYANAEAAAAERRTVEMVIALNEQAADIGGARLAYATAVTTLTSDHDGLFVAAENLAYQNTLTTKEKERLDTLFESHSEFRKENHILSPYREDVSDEYHPTLFWNAYLWVTNVITEAEKDYLDYLNSLASEVALADAFETRKQTDVGAYYTYAVTTADARKVWGADVAALNVDWLSALADEEDTLAAAIRDQSSQLAAARATAEVNYATEVALAAKTSAIAYATADKTRTLAVASADAAEAVRLTNARNVARESIADARGTYEVARFTEHANTFSNNTGVPLEDFHYAVATADVTWATTVQTKRNAYHDRLTLAENDLTAGLNAAYTIHTADTADAQFDYSERLAEASRVWSIDTGTASAYLDRDNTIADAVREEAKVNAQGVYDRAEADIDRDYDNDLAAYDVKWLKTYADAEKVYHLTTSWQRDYGPPPLPGSVLSVAQSIADTFRDTQHDVAEAYHTIAIADQQVVLATDLGDAEIAHGTALGDAGITFADTINTTELAFANAVKTAEEDYRAPEIAAADEARANSMATEHHDYTESIGSHDVTYQDDLGDAYVTRTTTVAGAEGDYHIDVLDDMAAEYAAGTFQRAYADAQLAWVTNLKSELVTYLTDSAEADAAYDNAVAVATADWHNRQADADVAYTAAVAPLEAGYAEDLANEEASHQIDVVGRENTRRSALADADKLHVVGKLDEYGNWAIEGDAVARAYHSFDRTWNESVYQKGLITPQVHTQGFLDADRDRGLLHAGADKNWSDKVAEANRAFVEGIVADAEVYADTLADLKKDYREAVAAEAATRDEDYADAIAGDFLGTPEDPAGFWDALIDAENTWYTTLGDARADLFAAEYTEAALRWTDATDGLATDTGATWYDRPWTNLQVALAQAKRDWWWDTQTQSGFKDTYLTYVADVNAEWKSYQDDVNDDYLTEAYALADFDKQMVVGLADPGGLTGTAEAEQIRAKAVADAEADYIGNATTEAIAADIETYVKAMALDAKSVAAAAADPTDHPYTTAQHDAAVLAAADAYALAEADHGGKRTTDIADANDAFVLTIYGLTEVRGTDGTFIILQNNRAEAIETYVTAEANRFVQAAIAAEGWDVGADSAGLVAEYRAAEATSLAAAIRAVADSTGNDYGGTPWAVYEADLFEAFRDLEAGDPNDPGSQGLAEAEARRRTAEVEAFRDMEVGIAADEKDRAVELADAQAQRYLDLSKADLDAAEYRAAIDYLLAVTEPNAFHPPLPELPVTPTTDADTVIDGIDTADYQLWGSDATYDEIVAAGFGVPYPTPELIFFTGRDVCYEPINRYTSGTTLPRTGETDHFRANADGQLLREGLARDELHRTPQEEQTKADPDSAVMDVSWAGVETLGTVPISQLDGHLDARKIKEWVDPDNGSTVRFEHNLSTGQFTYTATPSVGEQVLDEIEPVAAVESEAPEWATNFVRGVYDIGATAASAFGRGFMAVMRFFAHVDEMAKAAESSGFGSVAALPTSQLARVKAPEATPPVAPPPAPVSKRSYWAERAAGLRSATGGGVQRGVESMHRDLRRLNAAVEGAKTFAHEFIGKPYVGSYLAAKESVVGTGELISAIDKDPYGTVVNTANNIFVAIATVDMWAPGAARQAGATAIGSDNTAKSKMFAGIYLAIVVDPKSLVGKAAGTANKVNNISGAIGDAIKLGDKLDLDTAKAAIRAEGVLTEIKAGKITSIPVSELPDAKVTQLARELQDAARKNVPGRWIRPKDWVLPKNGEWAGAVGDSGFIPDNRAKLGLRPGEVIPFRNGRVDFSEWSKENFTAKEVLTGNPVRDRAKMIRTIAKEKGWTQRKVEDWLQEERLSLHHAGGDEIQLVPWELHGNRRAIPPEAGVSHQGGAFDLRNPK